MIKIPVHRVPDRSCKARGRAKATVVAVAIVDDDRADLKAHFWTLHSGYAARREGGCRFMHHDIIGRKPGMDVSHENANKLDNRRGNLLHLSRSDNMLNPADGPNRSRVSCPYRGVTRDDRSRGIARWRRRNRA